MTIISDELRTARKDHICNFCGCEIKKGEKYKHTVIADNGSVYNWKSHLGCEEAVEIYNMDEYGDGVTHEDFVDCINDALFDFKHNQGRENTHLIHEEEMTMRDKVKFLLEYDDR